jgi:hypothetical protein
MGKLLALTLTALMASTSTPAADIPPPHDPRFPVTRVFDGMPPERLFGPAKAEISFGTVGECGTPPPDLYFKACVRYDMLGRGTVHMPNPCDPKYRWEAFAVLMCHEKAHINGWPGSHGP